MTTPIERLRKLHRPCVVPCFDHSWVGDRQHCAGPFCLASWPCDTIAALGALEGGAAQSEAEVVSLRVRIQRQRDRLDAATVLIRQALYERHMHWGAGEERHCGSRLGTSIDTCPNCAPFREWLAGDKEAGK